MKKLLTTCAIAALMTSVPALAQEDTEQPETEAPAQEAPAEEAPADDGAAEEMPAPEGDTQPAPEGEGEAAPAAETVKPQQESQELLSSWVTGTQVMSTQMEPIGEIQDLLIDDESGEVTGAVLSVGGFLGIGSKAIAVDWAELNFDYDANEITIELTREEADAAHEYQFRDREVPPPPEPAVNNGGTGTGTGATTDPALQ